MINRETTIEKLAEKEEKLLRELKKGGTVSGEILGQLLLLNYILTYFRKEPRLKLETIKELSNELTPADERLYNNYFMLYGNLIEASNEAEFYSLRVSYCRERINNITNRFITTEKTEQFINECGGKLTLEGELKLQKEFYSLKYIPTVFRSSEEFTQLNFILERSIKFLIVYNELLKEVSKIYKLMELEKICYYEPETTLEAIEANRQAVINSIYGDSKAKDSKKAGLDHVFKAFKSLNAKELKPSKQLLENLKQELKKADFYKAEDKNTIETKHNQLRNIVRKLFLTWSS